MLQFSFAGSFYTPAFLFEDFPRPAFFLSGFLRPRIFSRVFFAGVRSFSRDIFQARIPSLQHFHTPTFSHRVFAGLHFLPDIWRLAFSLARFLRAWIFICWIFTCLRFFAGLFVGSFLQDRIFSCRFFGRVAFFFLQYAESKNHYKVVATSLTKTTCSDVY